MKISDAFPSNFLRAADLQGRTVRARINLVKSEEIGSEYKPVVYFEGKDKGLVLNKTNAATIATVYGEETDAWGGADVELFSMTVPFQGQMVPAIRVRIPALPQQANNGGASFAPNAAAAQRGPGMPMLEGRFAPPPASSAAFDDEVPF